MLILILGEALVGIVLLWYGQRIAGRRRPLSVGGQKTSHLLGSQRGIERRGHWRIDSGARQQAKAPRCLDKELVQRRFDDVDEQSAHDEGEGVRSLIYRREVHRCYFTRLGLFQPDMMLWYER
jgi:hypothetical protein